GSLHVVLSPSAVGRVPATIDETRLFERSQRVEKRRGDATVRKRTNHAISLPAPNMRKHIFSHATAERRLGVPAVLWSSCLAMLAVRANSTAIIAAPPTLPYELSLIPDRLEM